MLNKLKLRKIKGKLLTPRYMIPDEEDKCEICGGKFTERSCKAICLNCGYTRDCSDP